MTSFHEVQFPPKIAYGAVGGAEFNTSITATFGGFEQRNTNWDKARGKWDISSGLKTKEDMETLQAFFHARFGKAYGFRFKNWLDYEANNQALGIGNSSQTAFQLKKTYESGGYGYIGTIKKPVSGTVKVYKDSILQSSGVTVDHTTGLVIFDSAPASSVVLTATFEFDVPVRFDTDSLSVRLDRGNIFVWDAIPLVEIRL